MIDLQPLTATEPIDDFGRAEALAFIGLQKERDGVDCAEDQLDALIADELFTA
jgi:hypothetical protein